MVVWECPPSNDFSLPSGPVPAVPIAATLNDGVGVLTITYSKPIDPGSIPPADQFTIQGSPGNGFGIEVDEIVGNQVTVLTVSPGIPAPYTHAYLGGGTPLLDTDGLPVAPYAGFPTTAV